MSAGLFDLTGTVALVTGGNGGIGLGLATGLASAGADVAVWGRDEARNCAAVSVLAEHGVRAWSCRVDVSREDEVVAGVQATLEALGRIDSVFANAGTGTALQPLVDADTASYRAVLGVNLDGVFWTLRESAKHMVERARSGDPGGSIVGIASLAAIEGAARNQAYAATKGAVVSMVRATAV